MGNDQFVKIGKMAAQQQNYLTERLTSKTSPLQPIRKEKVQEDDTKFLSEHSFSNAFSI